MRNLDCYLTENEQLTIRNFILKGEHDENLDKLVLEKYIEWNEQLSKPVPNTPYIYRKFLEMNGITCPIDPFFAGCYLILKDEKFRPEHHGLLDELEKGISECGASCPCPGDC